MACSEAIVIIAEPVVTVTELFQVIRSHQTTISGSRMVIAEPPMVVAFSEMT
jgi:hypothetical protein